MKGLIMVWCLCWLPAVLAEEAPHAQQQPETVAEEGSGTDKEGGGMTVFLLVFLFSILFVLSSATALKALGGKQPPARGKPRPKPTQTRKKLPEGEERFRL
jgi:hypothetical protein